MDIIYAINENIKNYNIVNLIYSYLGENPIIENTDITSLSIINYWEFVSDYEYEEDDTIEEENNKFSYFYFILI